MKIQSINPSNKENLGEVDESTKAEIEQKVKAARNALVSWKELGIQGRVAALRKVIENLSKRKDKLALLISKEMGMPISQSVHDVAGAIDYFNWYLDNADKYLSPEVVYEDGEQIHKVHYEPVGVVAAITPWNFPASNFVWMCGQNLVVGNTIVFKDSEEVPLCGQLIEEIIKEAGLPEGVFSEVYGKGDIGDFLVHQDIDMICFTGSTATGQHLYKVGAEKFIRVFLELGGSAPGIVFEDADIGKVIDTIYANRFDNCGQICDGLKRLIVDESKLDEVIKKLTAKLDEAVVGDATDEKTNIGPLVSQKQLNVLQEQVKDALAKGVKEVYKKNLSGNLKGFFYPPTLMTNITPDMKVWNEEVFGPVLPIVTFKTEEEAIKLANDTKYGLGGYVFTEDKKRFERVASKIQTGMVQMNGAAYVQPPTPFGGCKDSGIGREHGKFGFHELSNVKVVAEEK
ncbi:MAG: aldehyde dehydrogenase family protein [bacterium]|nr:aldehyde dehydrogenase family protein [bacterium]